MKAVLTLFALCAALCLATAAAAGPLLVTGITAEREYAAEEFAALPRVSLTIEQHGVSHIYEGVALYTLLEAVGAPLGRDLRGPALSMAVMITCADGYLVAIALADIDPAMRDGLVMLADTMDGAPLPETDGPFRLVVEGDKRPARSARMVTQIRLTPLGSWLEPGADAP